MTPPSGGSLRYQCRTAVSALTRVLSDKRLKKKEDKKNGQRWAGKMMAMSSSPPQVCSSGSRKSIGVLLGGVRR